MKFLPFLVLLSALAIAGCAAFFSIIGLKLLFVGGGLSIVVMGAALEVGKLITATFLKQKWNEISVWMRTYMIAATLMLVAITSIGIYGFLSAGYNATSVAVQGYERQIEMNTLKTQELEKEVLLLRSDTYNESEISALAGNRKLFVEQRLALVEQRNKQIEKIRADAKVNITTDDIASAKSALELAKAALESDTQNELSQIKLYNGRLEILDKEVQKWLDEGRGSVFRKGGLDKARETKEAQKAERAEIDGQIKKSQDRIENLRAAYAGQVKEYNTRVATIEARTVAQREGVEATILGLEKDNAAVMAEISAYNKELDDKTTNLNTRKGELSDKNKAKVVENQEAIQKLHNQSDELRQSIVHTDVGTFKFIAKSLNIPLDNAVNYLIWMIMIVFDPLAVCLILAFNVMLGKKEERVVPVSTPTPTPVPTKIPPAPSPTPTQPAIPSSTPVPEVVPQVAPPAEEKPQVSPSRKLSADEIDYPIIPEIGEVGAELNR